MIPECLGCKKVCKTEDGLLRHMKTCRHAKDFILATYTSPDEKIQTIKTVRVLTGIGLREAKELVNEVTKNVVVQEKTEAEKLFASFIGRVNNWKFRSAFLYAKQLKERGEPVCEEAFTELSRIADDFEDCGLNFGNVFKQLEDRVVKIMHMLKCEWSNEHDGFVKKQSPPDEGVKNGQQ